MEAEALEVPGTLGMIRHADPALSSAPSAADEPYDVRAIVQAREAERDTAADGSREAQIRCAVKKRLNDLCVAPAEQRVVDVGEGTARDSGGEELRAVRDDVCAGGEQAADDVGAAVADRHPQRREAARGGAIDVGAGGDERIDGVVLALVDRVEQRRPVIAARIEAIDVVAGGGEPCDLDGRADARGGCQRGDLTARPVASSRARRRLQAQTTTRT